MILVTMVCFLGCDRSEFNDSIVGDTSGLDKTAGALESCSVTRTLVDSGLLGIIICPDGSSLEIPLVSDGKDGVDGSSCSVKSIDAVNALVECADGSKALLDLNYQKSYDVVDIIDPCGDFLGHYDEVIVKFGNGDLLVYFESNNSNRHLTLLEAGVHHTTDAQRCRFEVSSTGEVSW